MLLVLPLITLWHWAAFCVSKVSATVHRPCNLKLNRKVSGGFVKKVHQQSVQSSTPKIGTQVYPPESVPSLTMPVGCQTGSLVWLMLDVNVFVEVIVRKFVLDRHGNIFKYNVWLDSACLVEADKDQLVQPYRVGAHVRVTALGKV